MNPDLSLLHPYPFEKLAQLFKGLTPPQDLKPIALSIGEPKHPSPSFVMDTINQQAKLQPKGSLSYAKRLQIGYNNVLNSTVLMLNIRYCL